MLFQCGGFPFSRNTPCAKRCGPTLGRGGLFPASLGSWPSSTKIVNSLAPPPSLLPPLCFDWQSSTRAFLRWRHPVTVTAGDQVPSVARGLSCQILVEIILELSRQHQTLLSSRMSGPKSMPCLTHWNGNSVWTLVQCYLPPNAWHIPG